MRKKMGQKKSGELIFEDNYEQMLEYYEQKLDKALASQKQFIASMSHEIRTPLNSIIGYLDLLKSEDLTTKARGFVDSADISAKHLFSLINDILDISKIEAQQLELSESPLDLDDLLLDSGVIISSRVHKDVLLSIELPRFDFMVIGDVVRIRQIFVNLLGNASKFTSSGEIRIYLISHETNRDGSVLVTFAVEDSGIGIDSDKIADLFKPFKQLHGGKFEGTGLGLYLTKALVEKMGGTISVESKPSVGTKFTFSLKLKKGEKKLPKAELNGVKILLLSDDESLELLTEEASVLGATIKKLSPKRAGVAIYAEIERTLKGGFASDLALLMQDELGDRTKNTLKILRDLTPNTQIVAIDASDEVAKLVDKVVNKPLFLSTLRAILKDAKTAKKPTISSYSGRSVLLVEDMELNAQLAKEMFKRYFELDLILASSAEEAIWRLKKERFDLVFMDIQLPKIDGIEATKIIREFDKTTPIVALSANAFQEDISLAKEAGMNDYLTKPIEKKRVQDVLERFLSLDLIGSTPSMISLEDRIRGYFEMEYSKESAKRLTDIAIKSIDQELENLKSMMNSSKDSDSIRQALHKLKGVFLNSGLNDVAKSVSQSEEEAKNGKLPTNEFVESLICRLGIEKEQQ